MYCRKIHSLWIKLVFSKCPESLFPKSGVKALRLIIFVLKAALRPEPGCTGNRSFIIFWVTFSAVILERGCYSMPILRNFNCFQKEGALRSQTWHLTKPRGRVIDHLASTENKWMENINKQMNEYRVRIYLASRLWFCPHL